MSRAEWNVEEAYRQRMSNGCFKSPEPSEVAGHQITDADRHLLRVAKETEGMPDEHRLRYIHSAIGKCLPFLTKTFVTEFTSHADRFRTITRRLVKAYKECKRSGCIDANPVVLSACKTLDFSKFNRDDWHDMLESMEYIEQGEYDDCMREISNMMHNLREIAILRENCRMGGSRSASNRR